MLETRMVCIRESKLSGIKVGDIGIYKNDGAEYLPGWDAGRFSVWPVNFPQASPHGHRAVNYWTENEMRQTWKEV